MNLLRFSRNLFITSYIPIWQIFLKFLMLLLESFFVLYPSLYHAGDKNLQKPLWSGEDRAVLLKYILKLLDSLDHKLRVARVNSFRLVKHFSNSLLFYPNRRKWLNLETLCPNFECSTSRFNSRATPSNIYLNYFFLIPTKAIFPTIMIITLPTPTFVTYIQSLIGLRRELKIYSSGLIKIILNVFLTNVISQRNLKITSKSYN